MGTGWPPPARLLIVFGILMIGAGLLLPLLPKLPWLGRLPGDIVIQRDRLILFVPLGSCLLISAVLSLVLWLVSRFR